MGSVRTKYCLEKTGGGNIKHGAGKNLQFGEKESGEIRKHKRNKKLKGEIGG